jgi:hypothetical protein
MIQKSTHKNYKKITAKTHKGKITNNKFQMTNNPQLSKSKINQNNRADF